MDTDGEDLQAAGVIGTTQMEFGCLPFRKLNREINGLPAGIDRVNIFIPTTVCWPGKSR